MFIRRLMAVCVALTVACAAAGVSAFDAITPAPTTVSTGGFSTRDAAIGRCRTDAPRWTASAFMPPGAPPRALRIPFLARRRAAEAAFHMVSIVTATGYAASDHPRWGDHAVALCFMLTFLGGCSGSAAGGVKSRHPVIMAATPPGRLGFAPMPALSPPEFRR